LRNITAVALEREATKSTTTVFFDVFSKFSRCCVLGALTKA